MNAAAPPLAVCESLSRSFGDVNAVREVSCTLYAGARVVIVGPSGSGKSTLLHLIAGIESPSSGTISWPALGMREQLRPREIGLIFQSPSLLPPLTVAENVALPLLLDGKDDDAANEAAFRALMLLDLKGLADKMPHELSGGQAQRVAVARVIVGSPRLVLADEPTGQLDHVTGTQMLDVLDEAIARLHATLLVSTHDQRVAARFESRWNMRDGRLDTA